MVDLSKNYVLFKFLFRPDPRFKMILGPDTSMNTALLGLEKVMRNSLKGVRTYQD
jgi:hypothetical protein